MLTRRIIPCLDVKDNRVVKGVNFLNLRDAGDPMALANTLAMAAKHVSDSTTVLAYARVLDGVQIGLINIARNKERFRVLPIVNWSF